MHQASHGVEGREWVGFVVFGALALLAFIEIGQDVYIHESNAFDGAIRSWVAAHQTSSVFAVFLWVTRIGSTRAMYALSIVASVFLWYRDDWRIAASLLIAPVLAIAVYETVKRLYGRARPPGFPPMADGSFSFPSAHATAAAAVCCSLSYALWREGLLGRVSAISIAAIVPLLVGLSRVYLQAHWATDVLGGWSAGLFIAALSGGLYHRARLRVDERADAHGPRVT